MKTFYHPEQKLHHPQSYYSRGKMRLPQEVPERVDELAAIATRLGFEVQPPPDTGAAPISAVHALDYLQFLQEAHAQWTSLPDDWGPEVVSNIFVRSPNPLRGVLAKAAHYLADGSCPVGPRTWQSAYWSAQCAIAGRKRCWMAIGMPMRSAARPVTMPDAMPPVASVISTTPPSLHRC